MSKGIGQGYVNRMKRYHKPKIKDVKVRISTICDRAFYHDGSYKFKLPRFYRDRLYRMRFPCESQVWNKKFKAYEKKTVYRYKSKNPLAIQMQVEVRNRLLAKYAESMQLIRASNPSITDTEAAIQIARSDAYSRVAKQKDCYTKMSKFYNYQRFKNRKF